MKDNHELMKNLTKIIERYPEIYDQNLDAYKTRQADAAWEKVADIVRSELNEECTVDELKIKWKGVRSSFNRYRNKLIFSKSNNCKKYYLYDDLQYLIPFTKPKGLPDKSTSCTLIDDSGCSGYGYKQSLDNDSEDDWCITETKPHNTIVMDPLVNQSMSVGEFTNCNEKANDWCVTETKVNTMVMDPLVNQSMSVGDYTNCSDTSKAKKRKHSSEDDDHDHEDLQFFKSILPDIRGFTHKQKRQFKRGVLKLIDDIENDSDNT